MNANKDQEQGFKWPLGQVFVVLRHNGDWRNVLEKCTLTGKYRVMSYFDPDHLNYMTILISSLNAHYDKNWLSSSFNSLLLWSGVRSDTNNLGDPIVNHCIWKATLKYSVHVWHWSLTSLQTWIPSNCTFHSIITDAVTELPSQSRYHLPERGHWIDRFLATLQTLHMNPERVSSPQGDYFKNSFSLSNSLLVTLDTFLRGFNAHRHVWISDPLDSAMTMA